MNHKTYTIKWNPKHNGATFDQGKSLIEIGTKTNCNSYLFMLLCHELWEVVATEMNVQFQRPDVEDDYIFMYDHRQHDTMCCMFSGLLEQFIGESDAEG